MVELSKTEIDKLLSLAREAMERAYAPYSNFRVGACLKAASGKYYLGCNIENAGCSPTNCAERTAMFKAVSEGEREFDVIAIISDSSTFTAPCGVCRQVLSEFCKPDMPVICADNLGNFVIKELGELLPMAFSKDAMETQN